MFDSWLELIVYGFFLWLLLAYLPLWFRSLKVLYLLLSILLAIVIGFFIVGPVKMWMDIGFRGPIKGSRDEAIEQEAKGRSPLVGDEEEGLPSSRSKRHD